ncbi:MULTISPECIES: GNAT family N-acetyltransferase [Aeromonas]|uniref:GNAT family N-acetyltransferase n=1 Tax=Aeromonas enteropelogenes TaxID=29489 RepID=A0ABU9J5M5_AEREN|nr:GNAT family N-acetyltransferase [Aeromonas sp. FDAARGOS 1407]QXC36324.1 GNAT family N-acetyltransferase [Aeromonas sp. FDAARGOS 1407]
MEIIRAGMDDLDIISPLFNAYRIFYGQQEDMTLARHFLAERLSQQESVIFFARDKQGAGIGFTQLYPSFSSVAAKRIWVLNDLYVVAQARRLGVAKKLMDTAKAFAMATNARGLALETARDNSAAQRLYESLGYRKEDGYHYFLALDK